MIRFLLKGIINDKSRSILPVIVVSIGVALTVLMTCWLNGIMGDVIEMNAAFSTGHIKIMTRAYAKDAAQNPNDLALLNTGELVKQLRTDYPGTEWVERIKYTVLIDFPDKNGETRAQGPAFGWGIDLLSKGSKEKERFNIEKALVRGRIPAEQGEALISDDFAQKFNIRPGDEFTVFGTTMDGGMAFRNFTVAGTLRFGSGALDRGAVIMDIRDARLTFDMNDASGEVLGYFKSGYYNEEEASRIVNTFNAAYAGSEDEFAPVMLRLSDQEGMGEYITLIDNTSGIMVLIFVLAMSVVLWNAGLLGGLRRYNEFGVRLALGEEKKHIYTTLLYEGIIIGLLGSIAGTVTGLSISWYLQEHGLDFGSIMKNASLMMPSVFKARLSPTAYYIGFIPGVFSMVLGNALSGIGIYKRKTAQLFKELEV